MPCYGGTDDVCICQSRAGCIALGLTSGPDPGERRSINSGSAEVGTVMLGGGWEHRSAAWPERFQDLASYCPPPQDELHTPQALQDEFNFRIDGQGRDCTWDDIASPAAIGGDPGAAKPWETTDLLNLSSISPEIEQNNIMEQPLFCPPTPISREEKPRVKLPAVVVQQEPPPHPLLGFTKGQFNDWKSESPIRSGGNLLLSQGVLRSQQHKSLYSLVKSEEPLITCSTVGGIPNSGSAIKLNSSLDRPFTTTVLEPVTSVKTETTEEERNFLPFLKKEKSALYTEEENVCDLFKVPQMGETMEGNSGVDNRKEKRKGRPKLKLNIGAANTSGNGPAFISVDTPDVMRSLTDESASFDLLSFVMGEFDENVLTADPANLVLEAVKTDHDYTGARVGGELEVKTEPLEEDDVEDDEDREEARGIKRRRSSALSGDDEPYDSATDEDSEDDSQDWSPYKRKTCGSSKGSGKKRGKSRASSSGGKKLRKRSVDSEESVGQDRYRELRDRNNEASRKSRLNRKQKEIEMGLLADNLEKENVELKQKAESLEKLVKKLREVLMNIVLKK